MFLALLYLFYYCIRGRLAFGILTHILYTSPYHSPDTVLLHVYMDDNNSSLLPNLQ